MRTQILEGSSILVFQASSKGTYGMRSAVLDPPSVPRCVPSLLLTSPPATIVVRQLNSSQQHLQPFCYLLAFGPSRHRAWMVGQRPHGCWLRLWLPSRGPLGGSCEAAWVPFWGLLGPIWGLLVASWGLLGASWGAPWGFLGASCVNPSVKLPAAP